MITVAVRSMSVDRAMPAANKSRTQQCVQLIIITFVELSKKVLVSLIDDYVVITK